MVTLKHVDCTVEIGSDEEIEKSLPDINPLTLAGTDGNDESPDLLMGESGPIIHDVAVEPSVGLSPVSERPSSSTPPQNTLQGSDLLARQQAISKEIRVLSHTHDVDSARVAVLQEFCEAAFQPAGTSLDGLHNVLIRLLSVS